MKCRTLSVNLTGFPMNFQAVIAELSQEIKAEAAGRMCEVGPPASVCSFFTYPYSRLRRSTGILICVLHLRGWK